MLGTSTQGDFLNAQTLYDKLWKSHLVREYADGAGLLYIDRQLLHEVSSPQAFAGMKSSGREIRRPNSHLLVADHAIPTRRPSDGRIPNEQARAQVQLLADNAIEFELAHFGMSDARHGIVHVIGPEQGFTQPGITLVCGDSHTTTHGAFGALAFGIGASECERVLATQTLRQTRARNLRVCVEGAFTSGVFAKDLALAIVGTIGASGGQGYAIEYCGETVRQLSMEARMTLCNMTIEAGSRVGLIAPDDTTFAYIEGRPNTPHGAAWERALDYWRSLPTDATARYEQEIYISAELLEPQVTWGTSPDQVVPITGYLPDPSLQECEMASKKIARALAYMGLEPAAAVEGIAIDQVFIGSCTNGRIEDLRAAAAVLRGRHIADSVQALVVPGSAQVKRNAESEGLDRVFIEAGFEWRHAGCSLCVAMNDDRLAPGKRCASTSNRNFEGRQGAGARTHLMSPAMAAAAAVTGRITDVRTLLQGRPAGQGAPWKS